MKYRKKPVVIEAIQWLGYNLEDVLVMASAKLNLDKGEKISRPLDNPDALLIYTLEGTMRAELNDWIIKGIKGEFYPCKPDIFEATYDPI